MPTLEPSGTVDADALAAAFVSVSVVGLEKIRPVKMTGDGGSITLSSTYSGASAEAVVPSDGGEFEFALNSKYAAVALETFSGRVINFAVNDNTISLSCEAAPLVKAVLIGMRV